MKYARIIQQNFLVTITRDIHPILRKGEWDIPKAFNDEILDIDDLFCLKCDKAIEFQDLHAGIMAHIAECHPEWKEKENKKNIK
jgi:hypothetical protein